MIENLKGLERLLKAKKEQPVVGVVCAHDKGTMLAVKEALEKGLMTAVLIGEKRIIQGYVEEFGIDETLVRVQDCLGDDMCAKRGVELVKEHKITALMKGKIQTKDLLKAVVDSKKGIKESSVLSHVALNEIPGYHKLVATTDGGMMLYPSQDEKVEIIKNAVQLYNKLGYKCPNVALLSAVEVVNAKMQDTVEADAIKNMSWQGCTVEGPISYDLAFSKASAEKKGYKSSVTGEVDILAVPNITVGNILGKSLIYSAGGKMAGVVLGAKVPIILTSRGSTAEEKYYSIVLAACL